MRTPLMQRLAMKILGVMSMHGSSIERAMSKSHGVCSLDDCSTVVFYDHSKGCAVYDSGFVRHLIENSSSDDFAKYMERRK